MVREGDEALIPIKQKRLSWSASDKNLQQHGRCHRPLSPRSLLLIPTAACSAWLPMPGRALVDRSGWQRRFPVQVTAWERPVLASPSVQLWNPETATVDPIVEGLFEQLAGLIAHFSGVLIRPLEEPGDVVAGPPNDLQTLAPVSRRRRNVCLGRLRRRGWLEKDDVLNTRTWAQLKRLLKR